MTFKNEQELRKYLTKRVERDVVGKTWLFNGVKFINNRSSYFQGDFFTQVDYTCDLKKLSVIVYRGYEGFSNYEVIAEKTFCDENAIADCIAWVVDKLVEIYTKINERVAPYAYGKAMYERQLRQPIKLQE